MQARNEPVGREDVDPREAVLKADGPVNPEPTGDKPEPPTRDDLSAVDAPSEDESA